jgi:hypothetical protein
MRADARWRKDQRSARVAWACGLAALACSCLVTDRTEFGEPNVPAHLKPVSPAEFTRVPIQPDSACNSMGGPDPESPSDITPWMAFTVEVSDPNVEDVLGARLVVNGSGEADGVTIARTDKVERGTITLCAKRREFDEPCNRVEFLVSSSFSIGGHPYGTDIAGDLVREKWWVLNAAGDDPTVTASDCETRQADAGPQ